MSLIQAENLTFAYDGSYNNVFENVSFRIDTDWKLGLSGRNGRGKTTLLRLLLGGMEYRGSIQATVGFDYFPFPVADTGRPTIELLAGIAPEAETWQLERELSLLGIEETALHRPFATLSMGEQTKALLAALFSQQNRFLLLDEPTNHLDLEGRQLVADYLRSKQGFLLVSHDRAFLDACIDHIMSLNRTSIEIERGNFSSWWENRQKREAYERTANERLSKEVKKLSEEARRTAAWSDKVEKTKIGHKPNSGVKADKGYIGAKSAKMMKRSLHAQAKREQALAEKQGLLKDVENTAELFMRPEKHHAQTLLEASEIRIQYAGRQELGPFSFTLRQGQRLALTGGNGSGKSSLLKLILGENIPYTGSLRRAANLNISYLPQDSSFLRGSLRAWLREQGVDETLCLTALRKLDFSRDHFEANMEELSAGQKKKLLLAASLVKPSQLYIWDEPLNYIDVFSRMQIEEVLLQQSPTLLFVEHDAAFVNNIATDCLTL